MPQGSRLRSGLLSEADDAEGAGLSAGSSRPAFDQIVERGLRRMLVAAGHADAIGVGDLERPHRCRCDGDSRAASKSRAKAAMRAAAEGCPVSWVMSSLSCPSPRPVRHRSDGRCRRRSGPSRPPRTAAGFGIAGVGRPVGGQAEGIGAGDPEAVEGALPGLVLVVLEAGARMQDGLVVEQLQVAGLEVPCRTSARGGARPLSARYSTASRCTALQRRHADRSLSAFSRRLRVPHAGGGDRPRRRPAVRRNQGGSSPVSSPLRLNG